MLGVWIASGVIGGLLLITFVYGLAIRSMYREKLRTDEVYLVSTQDEWKLRVCRYRRGRTLGEPVLLCHGAGANHHNFSFPGNDSLIDFLVAKGYDCWAVDLRGCRSSQPPDGKKRFDAKLDDYLLQDLPAVIEHIRRVTGYHTMHWIGHSLGGLLLYAYAREFGVRSLAGCVTLGAPIGFDGTHVAAPDFLVRFFARHPRFVTALAHAYVPIGRTLHLPLGFFPISLRNLHPNITTEHLFLMLDNLLPDVFVTLADWARGKKCVMKGGALDVKAGLAALRAPLLVFLAPRDPFVSLEYGWRFFDALPTRDKQMIVLGKDHGCIEDYNHVEMPFSRAARQEVFMPIAAWLAAHPAHRLATERRDANGRLVGVAALAPHERLGVLSGSSFERLTQREQDTPTTDAPRLEQAETPSEMDTPDEAADPAATRESSPDA